ncbi:MAG: protein phosphatase 2C domain-containing protein [Defluviitaleaceae bacterium]|nr:protein phosphatase 2C domain-containing protein [Defluviitaleaceae bacterium]
MAVSKPDFKYDFVAKGQVDIGRRRSSNQDEIMEFPESRFFGVSDGMGGLLHGGLTSELIKDQMEKIMSLAHEELAEDYTPQNAGNILKSKIRELNEKIYELGKEHGRNSYGATLSGVWLVDNCAVFINIGDSRGYMVRKGKIHQITKDHNLAAYLVGRGEITEEESRNHPASSRLLKFMGMTPPASPEIFIEEIMAGDELLIASDGLFGMLYDKEIEEILNAKKDCRESDIEQVLQKLTDAANEQGGKDNIGMVYVVICGRDKEQGEKNERQGERKGHKEEREIKEMKDMEGAKEAREDGNEMPEEREE